MSILSSAPYLNDELLLEAGFAPEQVIRIMTYNGAVTLGIGDTTGLIAPGYQADLLVIDGDLSVDPTNIRNLDVVFRDGIGFSPARLLEDVRGRVGRP